MLKTLTRAAAAALVISSVGVSSAHAERLTISTWGSPKHFQVKEFVPLFEKLVKEKSGGKLRTRAFDGGEMVKQQFVATAVPQGTVDISLSTLDTWAGRIPEISILASPLWDKSMEWTRDNLKPGKPIFDYFNNKMKANGAVMLAMFDISPPVVSTNFAINSPEDFKGKAIRVYSKGSGEIVQALGGSPTIMGVGDVYSGLQRGTVAGAMGGLGGAVGLKHYEVTKFMLVQNGVLGTLINAYVMNKEKFDKLSPDLRKAVMDAAAEARDHMQQYSIDKLASLIAEVRKHGNTITEIKPGSAEWAAWQKALEPLTDRDRKAFPADLVKLVTGK